MEIELGGLYIHYQNRKTYMVHDEKAKVQMNGHWYSAIIYQEFPAGNQTFVRSMIDFEESFTPKPAKGNLHQHAQESK